METKRFRTAWWSEAEKCDKIGACKEIAEKADIAGKAAYALLHAR